MDDAFKVLGAPDKTVTGGKCLFENGVYYKGSTGDEGRPYYYARKEHNVRIFAPNDKIIALYMTRPIAQD